MSPSTCADACNLTFTARIAPRTPPRTSIETAELHNEAYATNDGSRCYWCKTELFGALAPLARDLGARVLVGTNADDLGDHRPGIAAGREHGALTPLADAGLGKDEVRALSRAAGLPTSEQPASPCLASRFAYGVRVTEPGLRRIEKAEEKMRELGFSVLRVRDHGDDLARIEVPPEDVPRVAALRAEIARDLVALGFKFVSVDLMGFRSGSLNAVLPAPTLGTR